MKLSPDAEEKREERERQLCKGKSERIDNTSRKLHKFTQERLQVLSDLQILVITFLPCNIEIQARFLTENTSHLLLRMLYF